MEDKRDIYVRKKLKMGHISQGSIFSGAKSETYCDCPVFGVVITARCSIANTKVPSFHYLPLISLHDWLNHDFKELLLEDTRNKYINRLKDILKQNKISVEIVGRFKYRDISSKFIDNFSGKQKTAFKEVITTLIEFEEEKIIELDKLVFLNNRGAETIIKRLLSHDFVNFYIIEDWGDPNKYYVILLREIMVLRKDIFFKIGKGLMAEHLCDNDIRTNDISPIGEDDIYYVYAQIDSPFIEHILQRFHYNFGRIGVEDMHTNTVTNLIQLLA